MVSCFILKLHVRILIFKIVIISDQTIMVRHYVFPLDDHLSMHTSLCPSYMFPCMHFVSVSVACNSFHYILGAKLHQNFKSVTVLIVCTSSDESLWLYQVARKCHQ